MIPRAASALFERLDGPRPATNRNSMSGLRTPARYSMQPGGYSSKLAEKNWTLKATYVEIYNESLRDLLVPEHTPQNERSQVTIREDTKGHILLTGLTAIEVNSVEDLLAALNFGSTIRQTDSTAINAKSSRSHAVFCLNLVQRKSKMHNTPASEKRFSVPLEAMTGAESWVTIDSKLHFVDLAGSERLKNTGAQGERAKEGISINAGLASLGKVISQLSSRQQGSHVSYRDSKLTRLLQDSLGGNAITYMIACVTPAEFHLSETLNTVQYAQRARAIQSKPRIQQVSDETDKQALIDRLKAEVAFLRDQIRSTERSGDQHPHGPLNERSERQNATEIELQNQLLDTQESYTALSQRHAKLISEMTRARDSELAENRALESTLGDSATERLKRSNSFAEAVEEVVLEYEETIRSLEQSLSSTRATLSSTETTLLEKETKCAYTETVNQQLQARLQKLMDRESSTENYLHDLEAKLDGHTSGEEKNSAIVAELRKEIARVRENEASCEDYISTLEERLAEADSDAEAMQREIARLEHVVERQRSLGKLDKLLYELDSVRQTEPEEPKAITNGKYPHSRNQSHASLRGHGRAEVIHESDEADESEVENSVPVLSPDSGTRSESDGPIDNGEPIEEDTTVHYSLRPSDSEYAQSPAQSKYVADKLETVTQELLDLRVEHETAVHEFDNLAAKYEEALRTLAELQDVVDEARHPYSRDSLLSVTSPGTTRPTSFLADARVNELRENGGQYSSSRSLSSELSLAGELPSMVHGSDAEAAIKKLSESGAEVQEEAQADETLAVEVENLRRLAEEKEHAQADLVMKYAQLQDQHQETLDMVEELKSEVQKARMEVETSPRSASPIIRRKSSQNVMIIDRAHRSFASLRNIAAENFEGQEDVMQNFDLNLNTAMHELHARSERVQELEADIAAVKKEMETKMTIISGLTRERSSMKHSSPMDMSVVSTMRDQLMQSENQIRILQETHQARERELNDELQALRSTIEEHSRAAMSAAERAIGEQEDLKAAQDGKIADLEAELATWEERHQTALTSMQASEQQLSKTISELEGRLADAKADNQLKVEESKENAAPVDNKLEIEYEQYRGQQQVLLESLQQEIDSHKSAITANAAHVAELEEAHALARSQLNEASTARETALAEAVLHKSLISRLEQQIAEHETIVKSHQDGLSLLHANHAREIDELKAASIEEQDTRLAALTAEYEASKGSLQTELSEARGNLTKIATQVAFALGTDVSVDMLEERIADLLSDQKELAAEQLKRSEYEKHVIELSSINDAVMEELESVKSELANLLQVSADGAKFKAYEHASVAEQLAILRQEMTQLETKNKKNSRLVEELEDQLASNYDQHQAANNRLSTLQSERNSQLEEANAARERMQKELENIRDEYTALQVRLHSSSPSQTISNLFKAKIDDLQPADPTNGRGSNSSINLRKSASVASLPSPPPAIPLPPIPNGISVSPPTPTGTPLSPGRESRPVSKDLAVAQIQEDQEARIRTIEKHLGAEKQLTQTLEKALTDLERQFNKVKADADAWRRRATEVENEAKVEERRLEAERQRLLEELKEAKERPEKEHRWSVQRVEEERRKRMDAERARTNLEERMNKVNSKKKKGSLNCF
jgi:chromosome segregation ATPase